MHKTNYITREEQAPNICWQQLNSTYPAAYSSTQDWRLEKDGNTRIKVVSNDGKRKAKLGFIAGLLMIAGALFLVFNGEIGYLMMALFGLIPIGLSFKSLFFPPIVIFDKTVGYFWRGATDFNHSAKITEHCPLSDIITVQTLKKIRPDSNHTYYYYELNIVLANGERINVLDTAGDDEDNIAEGKKLATFLDVPTYFGEAEQQ